MIEEAREHKGAPPGPAISSNSLQKQQKQRESVIEQQRNVTTQTWFRFPGFISRGMCGASAGIRRIPLQAGSTCPPPHQPMLWTPYVPQIFALSHVYLIHSMPYLMGLQP